jgi:RNA recognition motif-containing protein
MEPNFENIDDDNYDVDVDSDNDKNNETTEINKVFVGNVPYQCTREEFVNCFKDMDGFVNADIIRRYRSKLSRGFGFVVFENKDHANNLMNNDTVLLKDRILRFSKYSFDKSYSSKEDKPYQVFVNNLKLETTEDQLRDILSQFGTVLSLNITRKNCQTYGVATFESLESYKDVLYQILDINGAQVKVVPYLEHSKDSDKYKRFNKYNRRHSNNFNAKQGFSNSLPSDIYREGFKAGHIVGYEQGLKQGIKQALEQSSEQNLQSLEQNLYQIQHKK